MTLVEALGLWHGDALSDVVEAPFAQAPATRLEDLRLEAAENRFEAEIRLGRHADVLADVKEAAARHPLRERLAELKEIHLATLRGELGPPPAEYARSGDLETAMREMRDAERYAVDSGNDQLSVVVLVGLADLLSRSNTPFVTSVLSEMPTVMLACRKH